MTEASTENDLPAGAAPDEDVDTGSPPEETEESGERTPDSLPLDQVFGILKNQRRRYVLEYLHDSDGQVTLSDVAEQIAAWENDKEIRQITSSERKRVYVGLYQCHLPKMDGAGVVSFNKPRGTIEPGENAEAFDKYLDTDDEVEEPPWHRYSIALSVGGALVLGAALLLSPMTAVPVVNIAVVASILAFSSYSLIHVGWVRRHGSEDDSEED